MHSEETIRSKKCYVWLWATPMHRSRDTAHAQSPFYVMVM